MSQQIKERMELEAAMDNPIYLWAQGLSEREYRKFISILLANLNGPAKRKRLQKSFTELQNPSMMEELELVYNAILDSLLEHPHRITLNRTPAFANNFGGVGVPMTYHTARSRAVKEFFDDIREDDNV